MNRDDQIELQVGCGIVETHYYASLPLLRVFKIGCDISLQYDDTYL
jgi:hypothetical protein